MVKSMTGYGQGKKSVNERQVLVEISSVNHRYLDTNIRMTKPMISFEDNVRKFIEQSISRGKLKVYINYSSDAKEDYNIVVNKKLCEEYIETLRDLQQEFYLKDDISTIKVSKFPDVITVDQKPDNDEMVKGLIEEALETALIELNNMRQKEGESLKIDILSKVSIVNKVILEIKDRSPIVVSKYTENLKGKIEDMLEDVEIDDARLLTEVAIFADKTSIDEEITRLESHMQQLENILEGGGVIGRKLDFLLQEINREVNTIGSKANDSVISSNVIELKSETEKIREQVQNIE